MKYFTKPNLSVQYFLLLVLITFSFTQSKAQNDWIEDRQMNFRINVPSGFQKTSLMDGTDKIDVFVSPDQNMVIRVRSIPIGQPITDVQLQTIFEQNIIKGATRLTDEESDLNGIPARWSGYSWIYENVNTVLANYYIVREEMAYVVWAIVAENMVDQKTVEMANIMGSFELIIGHPEQNIIKQDPFAGTTSTGQNVLNSGNSQPAQSTTQTVTAAIFSGSQSSNSGATSGKQSAQAANPSPIAGLSVSAIYFGTDVDQNFQVSNPTANIPNSAKKIHAVFKYDGNPKDQNFEVKWFSETHNCLVVEDVYLPKTNGKNEIYASIENAGKPWPNGNYRAELWFAGHKISGRNFTIGQVTSPPTASPANGTLLGKTFADGTGDNNTKSKGGKYLPVEIKNLDDEDEILIKITSGTLQFVHIHFRSSTGIWYDAYHGTNTKFKVKDILKGDRNSYTHLVFNVNAQHERYLGTACQAEVWQIPSSGNRATVQQQVAVISNTETSSNVGGKYIFESRSDGKSLVNFHYILLSENGSFDEKYQPKNSGDYIGGGGGKWKQNGNEIIFSYDDGIVEQYTIKSGNRIERKTDDGTVFTFKKEL